MTDRDQPGMYGGDFESLTTDDQFRKDVARKFQTLDIRMSSQDVAINDLRSEVSENTKLTKQISEDTGAMLAMWKEGEVVKRAFCRMAQAWEFMLKKMCIPVGGTLIVIAVIRAMAYGSPLPDWVGALLKFL